MPTAFTIHLPHRRHHPIPCTRRRREHPVIRQQLLPRRRHQRAQPARARRAAKADRSIDIENVVREAVTRISAKSATDAERLRAAMRKAMDVLATAVDA